MQTLLLPPRHKLSNLESGERGVVRATIVTHFSLDPRISPERRSCSVIHSLRCSICSVPSFPTTARGGGCLRCHDIEMCERPRQMRESERGDSPPPISSFRDVFSPTRKGIEKDVFADSRGKEEGETKDEAKQQYFLLLSFPVRRRKSYIYATFSH